MRKTPHQLGLFITGTSTEVAGRFYISTFLFLDIRDEPVLDPLDSPIGWSW